MSVNYRNPIEFEPPLPGEREFGTTFPTGGTGGGGVWPWNRPSPTTPNSSVRSPTEPLSSTPQPPSELPGTVPQHSPVIPASVAGVFAGLTAKDWLSLAAAVAGITGAAVSGKPNNLNPNTSTTDPQLKELLDMMSGRLKKSEPLHDSILSMANGLLPTQYQRENPLLRGGG